MRSTSSFSKTFVVSSFLSLACHGMVLVVARWASPLAPWDPSRRPRLRYGDHAIRIVWLSGRSALELPRPELDAEPPEDEEDEEDEGVDSPRREEVPDSSTGEKEEADRPLRQQEGTRSKAVPDDPPHGRPEPPEKEAQPVEEEPSPRGPPGVREEARPSEIIAPHYPRTCRRRGHEGKVLLECKIDATGKVLSIRVLSSSGCDELDRSALDAVRVTRFQPARVAGTTSASVVILPVKFELR